MRAGVWAVPLIISLVAPPVAADKPDELPYEEGVPIPEGYQVEEQRNRPLLIAGGLFLAVGVTLLVVGANTDNAGEVGTPDSKSLVTALGVLTLIPAPFLLIAGLPTHRVLVREEKESASNGKTYGLSVGLRF